MLRLLSMPTLARSSQHNDRDISLQKTARSRAAGRCKKQRGVALRVVAKNSAEVGGGCSIGKRRAVNLGHQPNPSSLSLSKGCFLLRAVERGLKKKSNASTSSAKTGFGADLGTQLSSEPDLGSLSPKCDAWGTMDAETSSA
jgi:hypothetical protein